MIGEDALKSAEGQRIFRVYLVLTILQQCRQSLAFSFIFIYITIFLSEFELGIMLGVIALTTALMDYPTGALADLLGARTIMAFAYTGFALGWLLYVVADSFPLFILIAIIWGFSGAQASGTGLAWFFNSYNMIGVPPTRVRERYANVATVSQIATAVILFTGGAIATLISPQVTFLVGFVTSIITIVFSLIFLKYNNEKVKEKEKTPGKDKIRNYFTRLGKGVRISFTSRSVVLIFLIASIILIADNLLKISLQLDVKRLGMAMAFSSNSIFFILASFYPISVIIQAIGYYLSGKISQNQSEKLLMGISFVFTSFLFILMFLSQEFGLNYALWLFLGVVGIYYLQITLYYTNTASLLNSNIPNEHRTSIISLQTTIVTLVQAVAFVGIGILLEIITTQIYLVGAFIA
ncbi:MAG: MFS transporter, partial [Candidatus Hermodarchaeota archaeon]